MKAKAHESFKVLADPRVALDLTDAKNFMEEQQAGLSQKFIKDYYQSIKKLQLNPFYQVRYDNVRCLPLEKFRYMIHFKINEKDKTVTVYALISTYQNPDDHWL